VAHPRRARRPHLRPRAGHHHGLDVPPGARRGLLELDDRRRPAHRRRGPDGAVAAAVRRLMVGSAAHADRQPPAVHHRGDAAAGDRARLPRLRALGGARRGRGRRVLRRLLRRLRALSRAVSRPRRPPDRRARAEQPGDLPRAGDVPGAARRRAADLDLRSAAVHRRGGGRRGVHGGVRRRRRAPAPRGAQPRRARRRAGRDPRRRSAALLRRAPAGAPRRQRALGAGAGRAEDVSSCSTSPRRWASRSPARRA
jgi:hypothetical protein